MWLCGCVSAWMLLSVSLYLSLKINSAYDTWNVGAHSAPTDFCFQFHRDLPCLQSNAALLYTSTSFIFFFSYISVRDEMNWYFTRPSWCQSTKNGNHYMRTLLAANQLHWRQWWMHPFHVPLERNMYQNKYLGGNVIGRHQMWTDYVATLLHSCQLHNQLIAHTHTHIHRPHVLVSSSPLLTINTYNHY